MEYDETDVKTRMDQLSSDDILTLSAFIMTGNYNRPNPLHHTYSIDPRVEVNRRSKQRKKYLTAIAGK